MGEESRMSGHCQQLVSEVNNALAIWAVWRAMAYLDLITRTVPIATARTTRCRGGLQRVHVLCRKRGEPAMAVIPIRGSNRIKPPKGSGAAYARRINRLTGAAVV